jgi:conjugative transfer signal peptidase TraF
MIKTITVITLLCVCPFFLWAWHSGSILYINSSESMPVGVYLSFPASADLHPDDLIAFCIPKGTATKIFENRNYLPKSERCSQSSGLFPILKPVVAVHGDVVEITESGVTVNGHHITNSKVIRTDSMDREMPHLPIGWKKKLTHEEFFLLSTHTKRSLDSRYFGPIYYPLVLAQTKPLLTFMF